MSTRRILGVVALVVGVILLFIGLNATESVGDQLSNVFTGKWTDSTTWYVIGGLALTVFGLLATLSGFRRK